MKKIFVLTSLASTLCFGAITSSNLIYYDNCANKLQCDDRQAESQEKGIGFSLQLLYWKTNITTFPFAFTDVVGDHSLLTDSTLREVPFSFRPGFRVGANYSFGCLGCNDWDVALLYTHFKQSASNSIAKTETLNLKTVWEVTGFMHADSAKAKNHESFQTIDFVIGKTFIFNCPFSLRYYAGMKWARIQELMKIVYEGRIVDGEGLDSQAEVQITLKNKSKNIGLINGAKAIWDLKKGFGIYSRGEIALLRSNFNVSQNEVINGPTFSPPTIINLNNKQFFQSLKTNLVLEFGIQWDINIYDCVQLALNVGYEFNYWPTELLFERFVQDEEDPTSTERPTLIAQQTSDVGFRGFNIGISFEF